MANTGKRDWKVPENFSQLAWMAENGQADDVPSVAVEDAQAAFLEAEAISRRLGGAFFIQPLRVQRSDGWITAGYLLHYESFVPAVRSRTDSPEPDVELGPDRVPSKLRALEVSLSDRLVAAGDGAEAEALGEQLDAVQREIRSINGIAETAAA